MSKVLFDVTPLLPEKLNGIGIYTKQIFKSLKALGCDILPVYRGSKLLETNHIASHIGQSGKALFTFTGSFYSKGTIIHGADFSLPLSGGKFKRVLTISDLAIFRDNIFAASYYRKARERLSTELDNNPQGIIVPTEFIKGEFLTRFPKFDKKIHVIYQGCDHLQDTMVSGRTSASVLTKNPFFLYVGQVEKRKNLVTMVKAFNEFSNETPGVDLIIAGQDGFGCENLTKIIAASPYRKQIHKIGYAGPSTLRSLYQETVAFVYPSVYEGFGMPVIEAMKFAAPVITSNSGATAEVAAGYSHQVDPKELSELVQAFKKLFHETKYRMQLKESSVERAAEFSWIQTARQTLEVYSQL